MMVDELFRRAVEAGRRVRVETGIGRHRFSLAHAAIGWFEQERPLAACTALVVGAGEMGAIAVTELIARGADVLVCNRTQERAEALAARFGGRALAWDELAAGIRRADFVVATVSGDRPAVTAGDVAAALAGRAAGTVSIADLAVPRSVQPEVGAMEGVRVVDLDGLGGILPGDLDADLLRAREIVTEEAGRYILWRRMNVPDASDAMGLEGA
jgi:glutamyl-tRNA reductase